MTAVRQMPKEARDNPRLPYLVTQLLPGIASWLILATAVALMFKVPSMFIVGTLVISLALMTVHSALVKTLSFIAPYYVILGLGMTVQLPLPGTIPPLILLGVIIGFWSFILAASIFQIQRYRTHE